MKIRFTRNYAYAFNGYEVVKYKANEIIETDSEALISNSIACGAAVKLTENKKKTSKNNA